MQFRLQYLDGVRPPGGRHPAFAGLDPAEAPAAVGFLVARGGNRVGGIVAECPRADIDALIAAIAIGLAMASFDITRDGAVDLDDRDAWLAEAGAEREG